MQAAQQIWADAFAPIIEVSRNREKSLGLEPEGMLGRPRSGKGEGTASQDVAIRGRPWSIARLKCQS